MPRRAETAPSCMTPSPDSVGSSSCRAMTPPASRWYCSARRSIPAETTGLPSSVKPIAPASRRSAISVSSSPARPRVMLARKPTGTRASRRARSTSEPSTAALSTVGDGVGHRHHGAVAAGGGRRRAGVEVLLVLLARGAQVHVGVHEAREQRACRRPRRLAALGRRAAIPGAPSSAIMPPRMRTSWRSSIPARGIEHVGAADQQVGRRRARRVRTAARAAHHATAASIGEPTSSS